MSGKSCTHAPCRDASEEELQLGDKIAAFQQRIEQGEADQPAEPKAAGRFAKEATDSSESPEVVPEDADDGAPAPAEPVRLSYAAISKAQQEKDEEEEEKENSTQETVQQALDRHEAGLAKLTAELDDKVRFSKGSGQRDSRWK